MRQRIVPLLLILTGLGLGLVFGRLPSAVAVSGRGEPFAALEAIDTRLTELAAKVDSLQAALRPPSNAETRLLFLNLETASGLRQTLLHIFNTGRDPYQTQGVTGGCDVRLYGVALEDLTTPVEIVLTLPPVPPGGMVTWTVEAGSVLLLPGGTAPAVEAVPFFTGYAVATCSFPLGHGHFVMVRNSTGSVESSNPALILPSTRSASFVEAAGH